MKDFTTLTTQEQETLLQTAYDTAYKLEGTYGGCSQVVLATMQEVTGIGDEMTFQASYGFAGGSGLTSLGGCGALAGAILFIGYRKGRNKEQFGGGRVAACLDPVRVVTDHFVQKYGGLRCMDVQTALMGRAYPLYIQEENDAFNADGGHTDKCTSVCGDVCRLLCQMLIDGAF